jgi:hypothetical protein
MWVNGLGKSPVVLYGKSARSSVQCPRGQRLNVVVAHLLKHATALLWVQSKKQHHLHAGFAPAKTGKAVAAYFAAETFCPTKGEKGGAPPWGVGDLNGHCKPK